MLIAIGGEGTLMTTAMLSRAGFPVVAIPKTIDNDVAGTDVCVGYNSALTVATEAVDRLHTKADSHDRVMVLEVMGRHAGHLAAGAAIAGGAAAVLVPERRIEMPRSLNDFSRAMTRADSRPSWSSPKERPANTDPTTWTGGGSLQSVAQEPALAKHWPS